MAWIQTPIPSLHHRHHSHRPHHLLQTLIFSLILQLLPHLPFTQAQSFDLTYYIDEEIPLSSKVGSIANDSHISRLLSATDFRFLRYRLLLYPNTDTGLFSISNTTGMLRTASRIDREILCHYETTCTLHLRVAAQTESGEQFYTFSVKIHVRDINDNSPVFPLTSVTVSINEDASLLTSLPIASASDMDILNNTLQSYRLLTNSNFFGLKVSRNLDSSLVPQLYLKSELDREKQPYYFLTVLALDGGSPRRSGELTVNITVNDANDNAPMFSQQKYDLVIDEVTPVNSKVMTLKAVDPDVGQNGRVIYRLGPRQSEEAYTTFRVMPESGHIVTIRELTPLQGQSMKLVVEAIDNGAKPLTAQAQVNIHIRDSVNNVPIIRMTTTPSNPIFHVSEDARPGFVVTHFVVEDNDSGDNGEVQCHLHNPVFGLQGLKAKEYKVSVSQELDRESINGYKVTVTCEDGGKPSLTTNVEFTVLLTDVNDKTPKFSQSTYRQNVYENLKNEVFLRLRATDEDLGQNGRVLFSLGNVTSLVETYIQVTPSGEVITKEGLDRELFPRLEFQVVARDGGKKPLSSTARVIINVLDQNDNIPSVPAGYYLSIMENLPAWTRLGKIRAIDPDLDRAGQVRYRLESDNGADRFFNVTSNGVVSSLRPFNREVRDSYEINVLAMDNGETPLSNILRIQIRISDENDNAPVFLFPRNRNKTAYVTIGIRANTTVTRIQATDDDYGENATLHYSFVAGRQSLFDVDHRSGRVYTRRNVKRNDKGTYKIRVYIRDTGPIQITRSSELVLVVTQGNGTAASSDMNRKSHIIIVAILIAITIIIAILVFLVVFRFIRRDRNRNMRHAKYTGGLPMAVKSRSTSPQDDNSSEEGPWRRYDEAKRPPPAGGPLGGGGGPRPTTNTSHVTYDTNDDILMFKLRLADQYRELEPEDKVSPNGTLSRDGGESNRTSVLSDVDGGCDVSCNRSTRLATFQVKATPAHSSQTSTLEKNGGGGIGSIAKIPEEVLSSCSRDLGGTDSGRGTSEDGSQGTSSFTDDSGYPTSPGHVTVRGGGGGGGTTPRNQYGGGGGVGGIGNYSKSFSGSAFDRPPVLMTFQGNGSGGGGGGGGGCITHDNINNSNTTTLPSRRDFSYVLNKDRSTTPAPSDSNMAAKTGDDHTNRVHNGAHDSINESPYHQTFLKRKLSPERLVSTPSTITSTPNSTPQKSKDSSNERSINSIKEQINAFLRPKDNPSKTNKETRLCSDSLRSLPTNGNGNIKPSVNSSFTPRGVQETGIPSASIYATQNGENPYGTNNRSSNLTNNKPLFVGGGSNSLNATPDRSRTFNDHSYTSPLNGTSKNAINSNDIKNNYNSNVTPSTSITNKLNSCPQLYKDSPSKIPSSFQHNSSPLSTNGKKSRSFHNRGESPLTFLPRSPLDLMNESLETQDDGNTTTTSGSYTIDHEDLNLDLPSTDVYV